MDEVAITADDDGIRLDRWFRRHRPEVKHGELQRMLRTKLVRVDGERAEAGTRLSAGQTLRLPPRLVSTRAPRAAARHGQHALSVLVEDAEIMVVDKPRGIAVQGGTGVQQCLVDALPPGAHPVHRLDRHTSGALLVAKTPAARAHLSAELRAQRVRKVYLALLVGVPDPPEGVIDLPLAVSGEVERTQPDPDGRPARTRFRVFAAAADPGWAWVLLSPLTGRKHQLRAHLAARGWPVAADGKYGGARAHRLAGVVGRDLLLHAWQIGWTDRHGSERVAVAPLPAHIRRAAAATALDEEAARAAADTWVRPPGIADSDRD